tara:strand:+ start:318 stop:527 length:210 start_codon:yes stop_codon:yes gene_type:complete
MWKPKKKTLLVLMILTSMFGGLTLSWVNWGVFETGKNIEIYNEIELPLIFLLLAFVFMIPYVKKIKEEN